MILNTHTFCTINYGGDTYLFGSAQCDTGNDSIYVIGRVIPNQNIADYVEVIGMTVAANRKAAVTQLAKIAEIPSSLAMSADISDY